MLKGHVSLEHTIVDQAAKEAADSFDIPILDQMPMDRLWIRQHFVANIHILTVRGLTSKVPDPFMTVCLLGGKEVEVPPALIHEDLPACDFYKRVSLDLELPGPGILCLRLYSRTQFPYFGDFGKTLLGETRVDLEDRHLALLYQHLHHASNRDWIQKHLSPPYPIEIPKNETNEDASEQRLWRKPSAVVETVSRATTRRGSLMVFKPRSKEGDHAVHFVCSFCVCWWLS